MVVFILPSLVGPCKISMLCTLSQNVQNVIASFHLNRTGYLQMACFPAQNIGIDQSKWVIGCEFYVLCHNQPVRCNKNWLQEIVFVYLTPKFTLPKFYSLTTSNLE